MIKRENTFVEAMKFINDNNKKLASKEMKKINESVQSHEDFIKKYHDIRKSRIDSQVERNKIIEGARNAELSTAIKAIYITALEAETLTDNGLILAEELVDKYIVDEGGASKIMRECKDKTYLLNRICDIVEEAAREDMRIIFEEEKEDDDIDKAEEDVDYDIDVEEKEDDIDVEEKEDDDDDKEEVDVEIDEKEEDSEDEEDDDEEDVEYDIEDSKDDADQIDDDETEPEVEDEVEKQMDEELPVEDTSNDVDPDGVDEDEIDGDDNEDGEVDIEAEPEDYDT